MQAVIMAGGEGTRLRPLTCNIPKPMVPILNKPVMEYSIDLLRQHNIKDIAVTLMYLPQQVRNYFSDGGKWEVNLQYFVEEQPLGTAGSVKNAQGFLKETFIIISGDALTDIDIDAALAFHRSKQAQVTLVLRKAEKPLEYGVVLTDEEGKVKRFLEKPPWEQVVCDTVNTGIYILEPEILEKIPAGRPYDFGKELFPALLKDGAKMYGYVTEDYWCDIGDIQTYMAAHRDILDGKVKIRHEYKELQEGVFAEEPVHLGKDIAFETPVFIGRGATVCDEARLGPYTVVGSHAYVEKSTLESSILWDHAIVRQNATLRESIVCSHGYIGPHAFLEGGSVVGESGRLEAFTLLKYGAHIWSRQQTEPYGVVRETLRHSWAGGGLHFGDRGLQGLWGSELTQEKFLQLGRATATLCPGSILAGHGGQNTAALLANAFAIGACAQGSGVLLSPGQALAAIRHGMVSQGCSAGIYIESDGGSISAVLLQKQGMDMSSDQIKKLNNALQQDNEIPPYYHVGRLKHYSSAGEDYGAWVHSRLGHGRGKRLLLGGHKATCLLAKQTLERMGYGCRITEKAQEDGWQKAFGQAEADGAVFFGSQGEIVALFDEECRRADMEQFFCLRAYLCGCLGAQNVLLPAYASKECEKEIVKGGLQVLRCSQHRGNAMHLLAQTEQANDSHWFVTFDGVYMAAALLRRMEEENVKLSRLLQKELPKICCRSVTCPDSIKSRILQELAGNSPGGEEQEAAIGIYKRGERASAVVLPDNGRAVFRIFGAAANEEYAADITEELVQKIKSMVRQNTEES